MGNCGVGFAPCRVSDRGWLIQTMEGVEDIPGAALWEGIQWSWETFPEYLDALARRPRALDVAALVPHAAVRGFVLGPAAAEGELATEAQVAAMATLVEEGLRAGALGFTTSRTSLHRTKEGQFVAGTFAPVAELQALTAALGRVAHGLFGIADEHAMLLEDLPWLAEIGRKTGRPVVVNLSQIDFAPKLWEQVLAGIEREAAAGAPLFAQAAGRAIGLVMTWETTAHPFVLHPTFEALQALSPEARLAELRRPEVRARLLAEAPREVGVFEAFVTRTFSKMFPMAAGYEPAPEESVAARAKAAGRAPAEVAYDLLMANDGRGAIYFPLFNYADGNLDLLYKLHQHPRVRMGLSDGGAHCGAVCDGGMPTFMLTHWARDRARGPTLPLEWMVHRQTRQTATLVGLEDRGLVAPGYRADLNVLDFEGLRLEAPRLVHDLPAGGRRLLQDARGYVATICAGRVTVEGGEATGELPGSLIRGPQPAPG
jgi:N-acyl-D-aspartate/D-glutamate deacylase